MRNLSVRELDMVVGGLMKPTSTTLTHLSSLMMSQQAANQLMLPALKPGLSVSPVQNSAGQVTGANWAMGFDGWGVGGNFSTGLATISGQATTYFTPAATEGIATYGGTASSSLTSSVSYNSSNVATGMVTYTYGNYSVSANLGTNGALGASYHYNFADGSVGGLTVTSNGQGGDTVNFGLSTSLGSDVSVTFSAGWGTATGYTAGAYMNITGFGGGGGDFN